MKSKDNPSAVENLKYEIQQSSFKAILSENANIEKVLIRRDKLTKLINEALSEAERKAFEAGEQFGCYEENEQLGKPDWYNSKNRERHNNQWQYKNGAKI